MVGYSEVTFESVALFALRGHCGLGGDRGCRPFARTLFLASGALPPLRSGQVFLDEAEHFLPIEGPASLRSENCSPSARNAVRVPSGISVRLRRNPHSANDGASW
jgi:hypothetical protein